MPLRKRFVAAAIALAAFPVALALADPPGLDGHDVADAADHYPYPGREVLVRDSAGRLYATVQVGEFHIDLAAHVLRSLDGGVTWTRMADFEAHATISGRSPHLAIDREDRLHVVWHEAVWGAGDDLVHHRSYTPGTDTWSDPVELSPAPVGGEATVGIAVDSRDGLHVVWSDPSGIGFHVERPAGGTWSAPHRFGVIGTELKLVVDRADDLQVIGGNVGTEGVTYRARRDGVWQTVPETVDLDDTSRLVDLVVDSLDQPHATWMHYSGGTWRGFYSARIGGVWSAPLELLLPGGEALGSPFPVVPLGASLAIDEDDTLYVFASKDWAVHLFRKAAGQPFDPPLRLSSETEEARHVSPRFTVWPATNRVAGEWDLDFVYSLGDEVVRYASLPVELDLALESGRLFDLEAADDDRFLVKGRLLLRGEPLESQVFDPRHDELELEIGSRDHPFVVILPPGDPRWHERSDGTIYFKYDAADTPRTYFRFEPATGRFTVNVKDAHFPAPQDNPIGVRLRFGAIHGEHWSDWRPAGPGRFSFDGAEPE